MASMIDMVFLLLVFFMTVGTLAQEERVELSLPESSEGAVPECSQQQVTVSLRREGGDEAIACFVGVNRVELEQLADELRKWATKGGQTILYLRAGQDIPYEQTQRVLAASAQAGIADIRFAALEA